MDAPNFTQMCYVEWWIEQDMLYCPLMFHLIS